MQNLCKTIADNVKKENAGLIIFTDSNASKAVAPPELLYGFMQVWYLGLMACLLTSRHLQFRKKSILRKGFYRSCNSIGGKGY